MEKYNKLWRFLFGISLLALAVQQLICRDFRPVIIPPAFPAWLPGRLMLTWVFSIALIAACLAIIFEIKARQVSVVIAVVFLVFVFLFHIPYQLGLYPLHLGVWTDAFKLLTLSGGAFIVAGTLPKESSTPGLIKSIEKLIPFAKYFLAITMVAFGLMHFIYTDFVATLVPGWLPGHIFWTYLAGAGLMLSGIAIIINILARPAALLLGIMILIWFFVLHIPRAIADPHSGNGNEWTSVFEALAFSGIAFMLAGKPASKKRAAVDQL